MQSPTCPRCEAGALTLVTSRPGTNYYDADTDELIERTICIFRCQCGHEFAHAYRKKHDEETPRFVTYARLV